MHDCIIAWILRINAKMLLPFIKRTLLVVFLNYNSTFLYKNIDLARALLKIFSSGDSHRSKSIYKYFVTLNIHFIHFSKITFTMRQNTCHFLAHFAHTPCGKLTFNIN